MKIRLIFFLFPLLMGRVTTTHAQTPLKFRDTTVKGPQTFAMIAGVSKYKYIRPLTYADKDAELFRDYLRSPGGGSVKEENIYCILNDQVNNANFWGKGFQWLKAKQLRQGDRLFIYLAGHGDAIDEDQYFFLGYDCNPEGDKNNYLVNGAIQLFNLKKKIAAETAKGVDVFFVMDACRSNELPGGISGLNFLNTAISEKKVGDIMMLATGAGQESLEDASIGSGHGLFTWYLVDGLSGVADTDGGPDNRVTYAEIKKYVDSKVPSLALERFRRKQEPYFCCNENSEKVISRVDTGYLRRWLQAQRKTGGNSFTGLYTAAPWAADTALIETYNKFYRAIRANTITGRSSADEYFGQLQAKYPGNPYTLDAKSTLAVAFINRAQQRVDRYLGCAASGSAKEKQENVEAALDLEKAMALVREDDEDFANSLRNQVFFLKACGDYGPGGKNGDISQAFQQAYAALSIDRNGAYIHNKLAELHLTNKRADSALFYAEKAAATAPNWACGLTTLALVRQAMNASTNQQPGRPGKTKLPKPRIGAVLGAALNQSSPSYSGNANSGLLGVDANSGVSAGLGIIVHTAIGNNFFVRPTVTLQTGNTKIDFLRRNATGGAPINETLSVKTASLSVDAAFLLRFGNKKTTPYLLAGPSFQYMLSQNSGSRELLPLKKSMFIASGGLGLDISLSKPGLIFSPEISYAAGLSDLNESTATTGYPAALSSLKNNSFNLRVYLRKK